MSSDLKVFLPDTCIHAAERFAELYMVNVDLIGTVAGICTTAAFAPQALRVWKSRSVGDISLSMYIMFCGGLALWFVYGWQIQAWPIILTNGATLLLAGSVLTMKIIFQAPAIETRRNLRDGK